MIEMRIMKIHATHYLVISILIVLIAGCGGGGGGDGNSETNPPSDESVNAGMSGKIFIGNEGAGGWVLDLSTGHYASLPGVQWEDNKNYHNNASFSAYPSQDGNEFVETINRCEYLGDFVYQSCLVIHDAQGNVVSSFKVPNETQGPAKLSRDGMFVAVAVRDAISALNPTQLVIYTRDGVFVDASPAQYDVRPKGFDWLPDNRILYAVDYMLYLTRQASANGELWATFSEQEGAPDHLAINPNGDRLALTLKTHVNQSAIHGAVWVINLDASGHVVLAKTSESGTDDPIINFPMWSPDGKWIAVIEGAVGLYPPPNGFEGAGSTVYIVPSNANNVLLSLDGESEAIPVYSYYDEMVTPGSSSQLRTRFTTLIRDGGFAWIP
jgi:hypothetical protein